MASRGDESERATIDVYFDYASPFAYIASEILSNFSERMGVLLRWFPIDLALLSNYADGLPYSELKRRYVVIDAARAADFHNLTIRVPKPHPIESRSALFLALVAEEDPRFLDLHRSLFRAAWCDQRDISARETLKVCVEQAAGNVEEWIRRIDDPTTTDRLVVQTKAAERRGVFGVPSIFYRDELFWGIDSLPILEWRIRSAK
jgi:2-hydroxychromene-2-carboxylate isomerase